MAGGWWHVAPGCWVHGHGYGHPLGARGWGRLGGSLFVDGDGDEAEPAGVQQHTGTYTTCGAAPSCVAP
jgi:hypothetical protein